MWKNSGLTVRSGQEPSQAISSRGLEVLGHLRLKIVIAVVAMHAAGFLGVGMDVDRHDVFDIGQRQLGHFSSLGTTVLKLIIFYNYIAGTDRISKKRRGCRRGGSRRGFKKALFGLTFAGSMA